VSIACLLLLEVAKYQDKEMQVCKESKTCLINEEINRDLTKMKIWIEIKTQSVAKPMRINTSKSKWSSNRVSVISLSLTNSITQIKSMLIDIKVCSEFGIS